MKGAIGVPSGIGGLPNDARPAARTTPEAESAEAPRERTDVAAVEFPAPDSGYPIVLGAVLDGRYRLDEVVGQGGTATVYRGTDTLLDRSVAVKVFHPHSADPMTAARLSREIRLLSGVNHPHLVTVYDANTRPIVAGQAAGDQSYLVTEFVDGSALSALLADGPMPAAQVVDIALGIATALDVVHALGVVHRDVKPGNVLMSESGGVKLADFGIAREVEGDPVTGTNDVIGTAPYLSPEQARGQRVGATSDIYSLGLVLLECLTGRREFPGAPVQAAVARLLREPEVPTDLPAPWPDLLRAMTHSDPTERPTAASVVDALAPVVGRPQLRGNTVTVPVRLVTPSRTWPGFAAKQRRSKGLWARPLMFGLLGAAAAIAALVIGLGANGTQDPDGSSDAATSVGSATSTPPAATTRDPVLITVTAPAPAADPAVSGGAPAGSEQPAVGASTPVPTMPTADPGPVVPAGPASTAGAVSAQPPDAPAETPAPPGAGNGNGNGSGNGNAGGNGKGNGNGGDKAQGKDKKPDK